MHIERFLRNSRDYLRDPQSGADLWRTPQPNRPEPCRTWPLPSAPRNRDEPSRTGRATHAGHRTAISADHHRRHARSMS